MYQQPGVRGIGEKWVFLSDAVPDAFEIFYNKKRNFVRDK